MITQDTYAPTNRERRAEWYGKVSHVQDYELMTGPRYSEGNEYAREQADTCQEVEPDYAF